MRTRGIGWGMGALLALTVFAGAANGQAGAQPALQSGSQAGQAGVQQGIPLPPAVEKELAAKAADVTEVTLGKNMLDFAAKFMNKDEDEAQARKLIQGLKGIYVREYTFDKEGEYSMDQVKQLRTYFDTAEWTPIVHERERHNSQTTDVLMKMVNGQPQGIFVLEAGPKELTIVLIDGPIRMEDLSRLSGIGGLGSLNDLDTGAQVKVKDKDVKIKDKDLKVKVKDK